MVYYKRKILVILVLILSFALLSSLSFAQGTYFTLSNNIDHAYDGNYNTSANIFFDSGYIIYDLEDIGIDAGTNVLFTMNASDGSSKVVSVDSLDVNEEAIPDSTKEIEILGFKGSYKYLISSSASYIRINGIVDAALYIYEIEEDFSPPGPPRNVHANNFDHAYDGSYNTSANIFSASGYIIYDLQDLGIDAGTDIVFTMNASDGEMNSVTVLAFDENFDVVDDSTIEIHIFGFKMSYGYTIPVGSSFIKISGINDVALYVYEIEEDTSPPGPPRYRDANNLDHSYDGSYNTSANIFSGPGYIIYDLLDLGFTDNLGIHLNMNTRTGELAVVNVLALDSEFNLVAGSDKAITIEGFKNPYPYLIPATSKYLKIEGVSDNHLYIYEILECPNQDIPFLDYSNLSFTNNGDRTGTLLLNVASECNRGIDNLLLADIEVFLPLVGTWTNLAEMDSTGYWSVSLINSGSGSYELLITRNGSVPYSRNWTFKVRGETLGQLQILITQPSWTGTWTTSFTDGATTYNAEMILTQTGNDVTGTYTYDSVAGTISGTANLFNFSGISSESGTDFPVDFVMDQSSASFTGVWYVTGESDPAGEWNGTRN